MAVVNTLAADVLSLRGADEEFHRISRFFRTKAEAETALADGEWVPQVGVLNACFTGDSGILVYHADDTVQSLHAADALTKVYVDEKIQELLGDAPELINSIEELSGALGDDPNAIYNLQSRVNTLENGPTFDGRIEAPVIDNVIPFYYEDQADFPSATDYHGAIAHSHADGAMYFAHAGTWNRLANEGDHNQTLTKANQLEVLTGVPSGSVDLGGFDGDIIGEGKTIKEALQALETELDLIDIDTNDLAALTGISENVTNLGTFTGSTISDNLAVKDALQELETAHETGDAALTARADSVSAALAALPTMVHASWNASTGAAFDFANDAIASHGVANVTRTAMGIFRVSFATAFPSDAYTVTCGQGSTDYSGTGASPREVSILARDATYVDVICERSDDAVNEDNFYMSVIVMG